MSLIGWMGLIGLMGWMGWDNTIPEMKEVPTGSLWSENSGSLYADFKARNVGDLLTIVVLESTVAAAQAETKTSKSESASTTAGIGPLLKFFLPELGASGKTDSSGTGSTTRSGSLTTRLSVVVVETFPNGILKLEGTRTVQMNGETQKLLLTGLVRIKDIRADNTVLSTQVANAQIQFEGKGPIGSRQREGLITKLFKLLF